MNISLEVLEDLLTAPAEFQQKWLDDHRELERLEKERAIKDDLRLAELEQRWLAVPVWRRLIIKGAEWVQKRFAPEEFK